MKEILNRNINSIICSSVIAFIVGLIMIILPKVSIETIGIIAAIYIIVHGILLIYLEVAASRYYVPFDGLLSGVLSILIGILLLCKPSILSVVFTVVIGLWMILSSVNYVRLALNIRDSKLPWIQILILGLLDLVVGFILMINPFASSISIAVFAGIMLVVHSVINIVDMLMIKKDLKDISNTLEKKLKEATK